MEISKLDFDVRKYARDCVERFLWNARIPEFPRWIEEVEGSCAKKPE